MITNTKHVSKYNRRNKYFMRKIRSNFKWKNIHSLLRKKNHLTRWRTSNEFSIKKDSSEDEPTLKISYMRYKRKGYK